MEICGAYLTVQCEKSLILRYPDAQESGNIGNLLEREIVSWRKGMKEMSIYTMEYYSAIKKNTFESVLMRWMKLEPIIQSEVSQKDKDQYSILTHIHGI